MRSEYFPQSFVEGTVNSKIMKGFLEEGIIEDIKKLRVGQSRNATCSSLNQSLPSHLGYTDRTPVFPPLL